MGKFWDMVGPLSDEGKKMKEIVLNGDQKALLAAANTTHGHSLLGIVFTEAAHRGDAESVAKLLDICGGNLDPGIVAMIEAVECGHLEVVKVILDTLKEREHSGTPFSLAEVMVMFEPEFEKCPNPEINTLIKSNL